MTDREHIENVRQRFAKALSVYCGRGRPLTIDMLSDATGIPASSIYSMQRGEYAPKLAEGLVIAGELGAPFSNSVLELVGLEVRPAATGDPCPHKANAEIVKALHALADMMADGRLDHTEDPVWQGMALDLAATLVSHVNARRAGNVTPLRGKAS